MNRGAWCFGFERLYAQSKWVRQAWLFVTSLLHAYFLLKSFLKHITNAPLYQVQQETFSQVCADVSVEEGVHEIIVFYLDKV